MLNGVLMRIDLQEEDLFRRRDAILNRFLVFRCHRTCCESRNDCRKRPGRRFGFAGRMGEGGSGQLSVRENGCNESRNRLSCV